MICYSEYRLLLLWHHRDHIDDPSIDHADHHNDADNCSRGPRRGGSPLMLDYCCYSIQVSTRFFFFVQMLT